MSRRTRWLAYGPATALVVVGVVCGIVLSGLAGQLLTLVLVSLGLVGLVLLLFAEVGLSEDRSRERERERERARAERAARARPGGGGRPGGSGRQLAPRWPRRPR